MAADLYHYMSWYTNDKCAPSLYAPESPVQTAEDSSHLPLAHPGCASAGKMVAQIGHWGGSKWGEEGMIWEQEKVALVGSGTHQDPVATPPCPSLNPLILFFYIYLSQIHIDIHPTHNPWMLITEQENKSSLSRRDNLQLPPILGCSSHPFGHTAATQQREWIGLSYMLVNVHFSRP